MSRHFFRNDVCVRFIICIFNLCNNNKNIKYSKFLVFEKIPFDSIKRIRKIDEYQFQFVQVIKIQAKSSSRFSHKI